MVMTEPLVLATDVVIRPVSALPARMRSRLGARRGEYAVTRPRGRAPAKLVSGDGARLLRHFGEPRQVVDVVRQAAARRGTDPARYLDEAFPLLRDCVNARFLVAAGSADAAAILPMLERGDRAGRFTVLRCLRVLEDTELHQARDADGAVVALKLVRPGASPAASAALRREAAVLARLDGADAPALVARGTVRGRPWVAMTWCDGVTPEVALAEARARGPAGRGAQLQLARGILGAYARLHARGVLHGDVHHGNLLVGAGGAVTLLDFGMAHGIGAPALAGRAQRGGVVRYHAPEQARALLRGAAMPPVTPPSEQYAVATLLFRLFTGAFPQATSPDRMGVLRAISAGVPRTFAQAGAAPWPAVEAVLRRALAPDPAGRYPDLRAMERALAHVRAATPDGKPHAAPDPMPRVVDAFLHDTRIGGALYRTAPRAPTGSVMLGRAGTALALLRVAQVREDADALAQADAWLTLAESTLDDADAFASITDGLTAATLGETTPFHAASGVHLARARVALAMGDERGMADAVRRFMRASLGRAEVLDLMLGRAGTLLATTRLVEELPAGARCLGEGLRALGDDACDDLWARDAQWPVPDAGVGMAHGMAGLLHATIGWCATTGRAVPRGFRRRLDSLAALSEPIGRGVRWPQPDGAEPSVWAEHDVAGWCNGSAGLAHLWTACHARWGDAAHLRLAARCGWNAWEARSGAADLCCGWVGRAYAVLALYRHTGDAAWLERARQLADQARRAFARGTWRRPLSLFKGRAGLAVLAADLSRPERSAFPLVQREVPA